LNLFNYLFIYFKKKTPLTLLFFIYYLLFIIYLISFVVYYLLYIIYEILYHFKIYNDNNMIHIKTTTISVNQKKERKDLAILIPTFF